MEINLSAEMINTLREACDVAAARYEVLLRAARVACSLKATTTRIEKVTKYETLLHDTREAAALLRELKD